MSRYFIASIRVKDEETYKKYTDEALKICRKFGCEYLVYDNEPVVIEGKWDYTRLVMIRFNTRDDFNAWYNSEEYQAILKYRFEAAECDTILVRSP